MHRAIIFCLILLTVLACSDTNNNSVQDALKAKSAEKKVLLSPSSEKASTTISKVLSRSQESFLKLQKNIDSLSRAVESLIQQTGAAQLEKTQLSWKDAHNAYLATRLFRQWTLNLDVLNPELDIAQLSPVLIHTNHSRVDQHPLLPGYLDKVHGYPFSGLIHSEVELSAQALNKEHMLSDNAYVTIGFHALEFMLFGETDHPRLLTDLNPGPTASTETKTASTRRLEYIKLLSTLLKEDIGKLTQAWIGPKAFYPSYLSIKSDDQLKTSLQQIAEVELEACNKIKAILEQANQRSHDTPESITARTDLANEILKLLDNNKSKS